jgi:hypothetical protein
MGKPSLSKESFDRNILGAGLLTREKIRVRARALASMEGRTPTDVSQIDYEQAKRELTGKSGFAQQEAILNLLPEAGRQCGPCVARNGA